MGFVEVRSDLTLPLWPCTSNYASRIEGLDAGT